MNAADMIPSTAGGLVWERMWAPYDEPTYLDVLKILRSDDVVLEIGAGDLRLARQMAKIAQRVYAIEIQKGVLQRDSRAPGKDLPGNLFAICGDACLLPFPPGISLAVLLMRHCTHFRLYADKLRSSGCQRLATNARWRLGVEVIDLNAPRVPFTQVEVGWFACWCGAIGFIPGPPELVTLEVLETYHEVFPCPNCA